MSLGIDVGVSRTPPPDTVSRATSTPGDEYSGGARCKYKGREAASCPPTETMHLELLGMIVDVCRGRVVATRTGVVDL